jgi:hypothetical protein
MMKMVEEKEKRREEKREGRREKRRELAAADLMYVETKQRRAGPALQIV